ncbi:unnamed protein product [Ostreobium quekettii]|uniref:RRM domain-containing protein n=1 Tax=Ostreobium quekettii TaxID=121088 RepID=A0A8S1J1U3_9CHLO|nr:unnamed protein product [Ostreobium quekettii]
MAVDVADRALDRAMELAGEMFPDQPAGFPFGEFNMEAVKLPRDDDFGIPSDDDLSDDEVVQEETGFGSVIVVDNVPVVPEEKVEKLTSVIKRLFGGVGTIREGGFHMPVDPETKNTKGFAFIEFESPEEALAAQRLGHNHRLDRNHIFHVCMFDDFEKYEKVPEQYKAPTVPVYEDQVSVWPSGDLHCRDMTLKVQKKWQVAYSRSDLVLLQAAGCSSQGKLVRECMYCCLFMTFGKHVLWWHDCIVAVMKIKVLLVQRPKHMQPFISPPSLLLFSWCTACSPCIPLLLCAFLTID